MYTSSHNAVTHTVFSTQGDVISNENTHVFLK